jgi:sugar phosphate isomerase/epimerase
MVTRRNLLQSAPVVLAPSLAAAASIETNTPSKSRLKTAICAYSFRKELQAKTMKYEDLVTLAVDLDVDGLDLTVYWFPNTSDEFLLPLRRFAYRNGIEIYSISVRTDLCKPAGEARDKQIADLNAWSDVANKLGASHIRVFGGNVPKGSTEDDAARWVTEILKVCAEYSGKRGVILGLEDHGGITEKAERIIQIVKNVDSPWVGINLDTGNFKQDAYRQIEMCLPYAVNCQFKVEVNDENGKKVPSDWKRIIGLLTKAGYKGYLALEYESNDAPGEVPKLTRELAKLARA